MAQFTWYDSPPTVMSSGGVTTYIWPTDDMRERLRKDAPDWVARADERGEPIVVVTRAAVEPRLKGVDSKAILDAKLAPETTDTAAPSTGSAGAKEEAVKAKLETVLPVAEWLKLVILWAAVVQAHAMDAGPIEELVAP